MNTKSAAYVYAKAYSNEMHSVKTRQEKGKKCIKCDSNHQFGWSPAFETICKNLKKKYNKPNPWAKLCKAASTGTQYILSPRPSALLYHSVKEMIFTDYMSRVRLTKAKEIELDQTTHQVSISFDKCKALQEAT